MGGGSDWLQTTGSPISYHRPRRQTPPRPILRDADRWEGPLRHVEGLWYWNYNYTGEFLLEASLPLYDCHKVDFIRHHAQYCAIGGCQEQGKEGDGAAGRVIAYILSRKMDAIDEPLIVTDPKKSLSQAVERGLSHIQLALGAISPKLNGPLKSGARSSRMYSAATNRNLWIGSLS